MYGPPGWRCVRHGARRCSAKGCRRMARVRGGAPLGPASSEPARKSLRFCWAHAQCQSAE